MQGQLERLLDAWEPAQLDLLHVSPQNILRPMTTWNFHVNLFLSCTGTQDNFLGFLLAMNFVSILIPLRSNTRFVP